MNESSGAESSNLDFVRCGGEMAALIRSHSWVNTPLGEPAGWPESLRTAVNFCLEARSPINIIWGSEHTQLYNDHYRRCLGDAHPGALRESYRSSIASAHPGVREAFERALAGESTSIEKQRLFVERANGTLEGAFFTYTYTPIRDARGEIVGVLHSLIETTTRVLAERRAQAMRELRAQLQLATDEREISRRMIDVLSRFRYDVPFLLYYSRVADTRSFCLTDHYGLAPETPAAPREVLTGPASPWPLAEALAGEGQIVEARGLASIRESGVCGPYEEAPDPVLILPVSAGADRAAAVLVTGASARLPFDEAYRNFFESLRLTLGEAIAISRGRNDGRETGDREQLLAAERSARAQAENASRLKDEFLAIMAHELRTPLSNVLAWGRMLERRAQTEHDQLQRGLSVIIENASMQAQVVSDLLDMSRIAAGKLQLDFKTCDLRELIEGATVSQQPTADAKRVRLSLELPREPLFADVDATRIRQVVHNLVSNALKFTPEGGQVTVGLSHVEHSAELYVRDTGIGIGPELLPQIFDRFRQARGSARRLGGLGLGLAVVQQLTDLHGGTVRVESPGEGCGTTFYVRLPLSPGKAAPSHDVRDESFELEPLKDLRILVVEDDAATQEWLRRLLAEYGAQAKTVSSAQAALEALESERYQLLLSDLGLASIDGFALVRKVRERYGADVLPAIAVTAFSREEDRSRAFSAGFQGYLTKPYDMARLLSLARTLVGRTANGAS